jgi:hypothetical protein
MRIAELKAIMADLPDDMLVEVVSGSVDCSVCFDISVEKSDYDGCKVLQIAAEN